MQTLQARRGLTGNALKLLAAITMACDHIGFIFFPLSAPWRYVGRLALPIFSFMIAEGCAHTRSRLRYFLGVLGLGVLCQSVYTLVMGDWFLCVPLSFALGIALIFALQNARRAKSLGPAALWTGAFLLGVGAVYGLTRVAELDYGFWGCMLAVAASLFRDTRLDKRPVHVLALGLCLVPLALEKGPWQWWSLLALAPLLCYNGARGRLKMKYFFYIFYPGHLAALYGLQYLLQSLAK